MATGRSTTTNDSSVTLLLTDTGPAEAEASTGSPHDGKGTSIRSGSSGAAGTSAERPAQDEIAGAEAKHPANSRPDEQRSERERLLGDTRKIHERSWQAVQPVLKDLQEKAWMAVDNATTGFIREIHERISYQAAMIRENFELEADARLAARVDQAVAKLTSLGRSAEDDVREFITGSQKEMTQRFARTIQVLQDREEILRFELQKEAQKKTDELKKCADEVSQQLRQMVDGLHAELGTNVDRVLGGYQSRLQDLAQEVLQRAEKQTGEITRAAADDAVKQTRGIVDREISQFFIQTLRNRLGQLEDSLKQKPDAQVTDEAGPTEISNHPHPVVQPSQPSPDPSFRPPSENKNVPSNDPQPSTPLKKPSAEPGERLYAARQSQFRQTFASLHGNEHSYAEYEPAYRFGCNLAINAQYSGKDWRGIEAEVRREWEEQGGGTWEKFKSSIHYAWVSSSSLDQAGG